jgi:hypothetical protein
LPKKSIPHIALLDKLNKGIAISDREVKDLENLPSTLMICYLNGFEDAKHKLIEAKSLLKAQKNSTVYLSFKEAMRILRKMKYNNKDE